VAGPADRILGRGSDGGGRSRLQFLVSWNRERRGRFLIWIIWIRLDLHHSRYRLADGQLFLSWE
jgi:hypothetical protein